MVRRRVPVELQRRRVIHVRRVTDCTKLDDDVITDLHDKRIEILVSGQRGVSTTFSCDKRADFLVAARKRDGFATKNKARPANLLHVSAPERKPTFVGAVPRRQDVKEIAKISFIDPLQHHSPDSFWHAVPGRRDARCLQFWITPHVFANDIIPKLVVNGVAWQAVVARKYQFERLVAKYRAGFDERQQAWNLRLENVVCTFAAGPNRA